MIDHDGAVAGTNAAAWRRLTYAYALVTGAVLGHFLVGIPIQLTDSLANMVALTSASLWDVVIGTFGGHAYLRPLLWGTLKVVFDLSGGHYFIVFRGLHVAMATALLVLVVRMLQIRTALDATTVPLCLAVVLGVHTFAGTIREAFPINTFLSVLLCVAGVVNLSQAKPSWRIDTAAALLLAYIVLTVESGVLVWVLAVVGYLIGYRGISRRGLIGMTVVLVVYVGLRVALLHGGVPGLNERDTGFGLTTSTSAEINARFGSNPWPFYLYNVVSAVLMLLFAEPRGGAYATVAGVLNGEVRPWMVLNVTTSMAATAVIGWYAVRRAGAWRQRSFGSRDRLVLLFLSVLPVNALLCFVYEKDVIMSPAGLLFAVALFAAVRELIDVVASAGRLRSVAVMAVLVVLSVGWSLRYVGIHYNLRVTAHTVRREWAYIDEWLAANKVDFSTPSSLRLRQTLYDDAIWRRAAPSRPAFDGQAIFDVTQ